MHLTDKLKMLSDKFYLRLAISWTLIILWLSLISVHSVSQYSIWNFAGADKLVHVIFYFIFSILWSIGLKNKNSIKKFVLIFSVSFGILMEICQFYLSNGRSFELYDILANIIGSLGGVILFKLFIN
ncbi:MAG: VanZ family protein [Saprospiraceae bacterium]|nr:VanZ family protein [Saprospiraceae bacterium]